MNTMKKIISRITTLLVLGMMVASQSAYAIESVTFFHHDALGSTIAATDESGNLLWTEEYKPYGGRLKRDSASAENNTWYTGKQEGAYGLTYFHARWYDNEVGRFMAIDPVGFDEGNIQSFNRYAYANNNPYVFVDPDGRAGRKLPLDRMDPRVLKWMKENLDDASYKAITRVKQTPGAKIKLNAKNYVEKNGSLIQRLIKQNNNQNRVSINTSGGRQNVDLAGKPHKVNGKDVPTPHVQDFKNNIIPKGPRAGEVGSRSRDGVTRSATTQDLRNVQRVLNERNKVIIQVE